MVYTTYLKTDFVQICGVDDAGRGSMLGPLVIAGVSATVSGSYFVFSEASGENGGLEVGDGPRGLGINPFTNTVYIANYASDTISVVDGDSNSVEDTVELENGGGLFLTGGPARVAVNPYNNLIYVTQRFTDSVSVIDGLSNNVVANIPVQSGPWAITINPNSDIVSSI